MNRHPLLTFFYQPVKDQYFTPIILEIKSECCQPITHSNHRQITERRQAYYDKYFPNLEDLENCSEYHVLNINLKEGVTRSDLINAGLVEGDEDDELPEDEPDFYVSKENKDIMIIPSFLVPINGDAGIEQEDLPEGVKLLPENWEDSVPKLIGLKREWVEWISMDG